MRDNNSPGLSKELAIEDLKCPNEQLSVKLLPLRPARCVYHGYEIYETSGCGRTAMYSCYSDWNSLEHCTPFPKDELTVKDGEPCSSDPFVHAPRNEELASRKPMTCGPSCDPHQRAVDVCALGGDRDAKHCVLPIRKASATQIWIQPIG